ncbi:nucleotidyl transferase AbiEii/AbiGii toxin family protein [Sphingobacterium oryzagri]|uniref:Nucleotidyl transferase AbiEii/AbiGii toxin family protein n=1 Tax=Sphingobacterium oryzagri TaxID=3025669 RepID=A0ABY7WEM7_9SPHI|nr:nucleotidyl transferase AbiEii/AbiGii toxin family protein [Sphingobacterium sp. KACC 22765]WDF67955.1 nucleotidyl transferase AbiEii/AbiGii toxin family protein [Sphingobacterium sp. KACC 22765]
MPIDYLHNHKDFTGLLRIIEDETGIAAGLVEKDYWIMHMLYGLKLQGFQFELKGGTSLSKGYGLIDRFSEDIDIHIKPGEEFGINENPNNAKPKNVAARKAFYDSLAETISIFGITSIERDKGFDDEKAYRSGGIRLYYDNVVDKITVLKDGILLEAGFDTVTPNKEITISSWAYERAAKSNIAVIDNRAVNIACYHPGYTLVEKLQTIATKYRQEREGHGDRPNFMRQYYDVYCLLSSEEVLQFIGTAEYHEHKKRRFPAVDFKIPIGENQAFLLSDTTVRNDYRKRYQETSGLYYKGQPDFDVMLEAIKIHFEKL